MRVPNDDKNLIEIFDDYFEINTDTKILLILSDGMLLRKFINKHFLNIALKYQPEKD